MRRAHNIPPMVKAANLARWFPPWIVTREQWSSMTQPAVSGIAFTGIGASIGLAYMLLSVVCTCNGCLLFFRNLMQRRCELVIVDAAWMCRGKHCRTQVVGALGVSVFWTKCVMFAIWNAESSSSTV